MTEVVVVPTRGCKVKKENNGAGLSPATDGCFVALLCLRCLVRAPLQRRLLAVLLAQEHRLRFRRRVFVLLLQQLLQRQRLQTEESAMGSVREALKTQCTAALT